MNNNKFRSSNKMYSLKKCEEIYLDIEINRLLNIIFYYREKIKKIFLYNLIRHKNEKYFKIF